MDKIKKLNPTGIPKLDNILGGGIPPGVLCVLAGPIGIGRTSFMTKFVINTYKNGGNVLHIFGESTRTEIHSQYLSAMSGIKQRDFLERWSEVIDASDKRKHPEYGSMYSDRVSSLKNLDSTVKTIMEKDNLDVIVIDLPYEHYDDLYDELKIIADENNIAIWLSASTNRDATTNSSRLCTRKTDIELLLYKSAEQLGNNCLTVKLNKSKHFVPGPNTIELQLDFSTLKIE